ncbi:MAG: CBU_0592 family membrane protein [Mycobacteriaceae bacterium]
MTIPLHFLVSLSGYLGAVLLLASFAASSTGHLSADSRRYHAANLIGGAALMISCIAQAAWPSVGVNVAWMGISLLTLAQAAVARSGAVAGHVVDVVSVEVASSEPTRKRRVPRSERGACRPSRIRYRRAVGSLEAGSPVTV